MFTIKPFMATGRRIANSQNAVKDDPRIVLLNTGVQIFALSVTQEFLDGENLKFSDFTWLRYKEFETSSPLGNVLPNCPSFLNFRSFGHVGKVCRVSLAQSLAVLRPKKGKGDRRVDWRLSVNLYPWQPVLLYAESNSIIVGKIVSPQVWVTLSEII
jgi:hypothetical protein